MTECAFRLHPCIADVAKGAARESSRYAMGGVRLTASGDSVHLTATDGRWLNRWSQRDPEGAKLVGECIGGGVIIPTEAIKAAKIGARADAVRVARSARGEWSIGCGNVSVVFHPLDGTFPPADEIIPPERAGDAPATAPHFWIASAFVECVAVLGAIRKRVDPLNSCAVRMTMPESVGKPVRIDADYPGRGSWLAVAMPGCAPKTERADD